MPAWSRCMTGPAARKRKPKPKRTAASTSSGDAMPRSIRSNASRDNACCKRLARKPGRSCLTFTGTLPQRRMKAISESAQALSLASPSTTSTSGTRCAGMKKCRPSMRPRVSRPWLMALIGKLELLLARMASGRARRVRSANSACLMSRRSGMHSMTRSTVDQSTSSRLAAVASSEALASRPIVFKFSATRAGRPKARSAFDSITVVRQAARVSTTATSAPIVPPPTTTACAAPGLGSAVASVCMVCSCHCIVVEGECREGRLIDESDFLDRMIDKTDQLNPGVETCRSTFRCATSIPRWCWAAR
ncbi:hypothetical protein D3C86_622940 [compost metagenome]